MTGWYIAGPMRGYKGFNFAAFQRAQRVVEVYVKNNLGQPTTIFNPAKADIERHGLEDLALTEGWEAAGLQIEALGEGFDLRAALAADMEFIAKHADHLVLLEGWERSAGVRAEKALSEALGHSIWYLHPVTGLIVAENPQSVAVVHYSDSTWTSQPSDIYEDVGRAMLNEMSGEVRTTSSTGGQKGVKLARFDLIPVEPLKVLAEHYGRGAAKYEDNQWRKGYEWSKSYAALLRHLTAWWGGEDIDEETGSHHLAAVAWHAFFLLEAKDHWPEHDDRWRY